MVASIGAVMLWIGITQFGLLAAAYGEFWERAMSEDVRLFGFGLMILPIGIVVAAYGASPRQLRIVAFVYALAVGPLFLAGFRGHVIVHSAALLVVWLRKEPRVARRLAGMGVVAVVLIAPAVKLARNFDASLSEALGEARPIDLLLEMGSSLRPLVATCEFVDGGSESLWLGRSYIQAISRVMPNVSLDRTAPRDAESLPPSAWVTKNADPWVYERGGGLGFSGVAEPYLNFGGFGVFFFFIVLGYLLRRGDDIITGGSYPACIAAATFGFLLWTVRNDMMGIARAAVLSTAVVVLLRGIARFHRKLVLAHTPRTMSSRAYEANTGRLQSP